jgi:predicted PolB exonuclease-like 3'-5' exonuclease
MLRWSLGDKTMKISQDKLSRALGQPGKQGITGADVWPLVAAGRIKEVAAYCADDVIQARANYYRMNFITQSVAA